MEKVKDILNKVEVILFLPHLLFPCIFRYPIISGFSFWLFLLSYLCFQSVFFLKKLKKILKL